MDKNKLAEETKDGMMAALSMPGVMEWASFVDGWISEHREDAAAMGSEIASIRAVFDEILGRIVTSYGFPLPPADPEGLLVGFCSSFGERFETMDVNKELGVATLERFTQAVKRGMGEENA